MAEDLALGMAIVAEGQGLTLSTQIVAAGCLVTRGQGSDLAVLLVHRPKYNDWSLPKGKQDEHEHVVETAVREVAEEPGLVVALRQPLPKREYLFEGTPKVVHYWRAEVVDDRGFVPGREIDEIRWLSPDEAMSKITHPLDAELITKATDPLSAPFVVLRHGHAVKRAAWSGADADRPLDPDGEAQSDALVPRLAAYGISRVHSSATRRCMATVRPYAEQRGLVVVAEPSLTEDSFLAAPEAAMQRVAGLLADAAHARQPTVMCGHRPYLPNLVDHLVAGTGLAVPHDTVPPGSMIVLHTTTDINAAQSVIALEHHRF
ncbi:MAG TPA: NUDIX hydrolase [Actinomycetes bacterium]|nr:NUDIX hydrolase [Actinomycetes bacterium]